MQTGTVVEYHREYCSVELDDQQREVVAKPRGRLELTTRAAEKDAAKLGTLRFAQQVTVGDRVVLTQPQADYFVIEEVLPRETWLIRKSSLHYQHRLQCVVANADQLAVVVAPAPLVNLNIVDRYFMAAIQGGLAPILVVNKTDLDPHLPESVEMRNYIELGYSVYFTSARQGSGICELAAALGGKLTAFCGHSGVGKSTLLSALTGVEIKSQELLPGSHLGRQTTSTSRLYHLSAGGTAVDTPGIREFGLAHLEWLDLHDYFHDIAQLAMRCAYRDCRHTVEPECAVQQAVARGELAAQRLASFIKLRAECEQRSY